MKVLWISNYPLPKISEQIGQKSIVNEGWKITTAEQLAAEHDLTIVFPYPGTAAQMEGEVEGIKYISFPCKQKLQHRLKHTSNEKEEIQKILSSGSYDVIHIWGTEFPHSYAALQAAHSLGIESKTVVAIQGIAKECAIHYTTGVDYDYIKKQCPIDIVRKKSIYLDAASMEERGKIEDRTLELSVNCIGRTDFDRRYVKLLKPSIHYFSCNETLRKCFYEGQWTSKNCVRHSIFMSQATYPLKGLHTVLKALPLIKKRYPDAKLYLAGGRMIEDKKSMSLLKRLIANHSYSQYLNELVERGGLEDTIVQLGSLSAEEMKEAYLKANVYLLSSNIENSPNSLGEAMLLGVPSVASNVGGVASICTDNKNVLLYQHNDFYMLASRIIEMFDDENLQERLSKQEQIQASYIHNPKRNYDTLIKIYEQVSCISEKDHMLS